MPTPLASALPSWAKSWVWRAERSSVAAQGERAVDGDQRIGFGFGGDRDQGVVEQVGARGGGDEVVLAAGVLARGDEDVALGGERGIADRHAVGGVEARQRGALGRAGDAVGVDRHLGIDVALGAGADYHVAQCVDAGRAVSGSTVRLVADLYAGDIHVGPDRRVRARHRNRAAGIHLDLVAGDHLVPGAQAQRTRGRGAAGLHDAGSVSDAHQRLLRDGGVAACRGQVEETARARLTFHSGTPGSHG